MNLDFFLNLLNALNMGDIVNEVAYQIRGFEVNAGETDAILEESMDYLHEVLKKNSPWSVEAKLGKMANKIPMKGTVEYLGKFVNQLVSDDYMEALNHVRDRYNTVKVDRFKVKPIVKITGEFWAQTTEGDGNFNMFQFLHREGAQVIVEPIGTWIMYMIHQVVQKIKDMRGLEEGAVMPPAVAHRQAGQDRVELPQQAAEAESCGSDLRARISPHHRRTRRHRSSSR